MSAHMEDEDMTVAAIMHHTGFDRALAVACYRALNEGQRTFNAAKKRGAPTVQISRATLFRLLTLSGAMLGMVNLATPPTPPTTEPA